MAALTRLGARKASEDRHVDLAETAAFAFRDFFRVDWVEKEIRRHMLRARKRKGFGWTRWSRSWLYETLKLFNSYRVRRSGPKVAPAG